jgi:peroxiredoxin
MNFRRTAVSVLLAALATLVIVHSAETKPKLRPGSKAPEFSLKDGTGNEFTLNRERNNEYTVIIFVSTHCPASNGYNQRMADLCTDYAPKHVTFVGINSNDEESAAEVLQHARDHKFGFPVLKDNNNVVADAYGAQVTPEVFLIDGKGTLRYHGRIDDDGRGTNITSKDLRIALDALLAGNEAPVTETRIFGCSIKRVRGND